MTATAKPKASPQSSEIKKLRAWKRQALKVLNTLDTQAIGAELGLSVGDSVSSAILPAIKGFKAEIEQLRNRLAEARRRTIPMANGGSEMNFLPLCILNAKVEHDQKTFRTASGHEFIPSCAPRFTLTVLAEATEETQVNQYRVSK